MKDAQSSNPQPPRPLSGSSSDQQAAVEEHGRDGASQVGSEAQPDALMSPLEQVPMEEMPVNEAPELGAVSQTGEIGNLPAIRDWKDSALFSVLGFFARYALLLVLVVVLMFAIMAYYRDMAQFVLQCTGLMPQTIGVISALLGIAYAQLIYPSFFKEKPLLKSSRAIAFCNFFFGDFLFGALFSNNLTRSKKRGKPLKGRSWNVLAALNAVGIIIFLFNITAGDLPLIEYAQHVQQYVQQEGQGAESARDAFGERADQLSAGADGKEEAGSTTFRDEESGVSFAIPSGWQRTSIPDDYIDDIKCVLVPSDGANAQIVFMTFDMYGSASEEERQGLAREELNTAYFTEDYVLSNTRGDMVDVQSESAELVTAGGKEYWQVRVDGISSAGQIRSGGQLPLTEINYFHFDNGYAYYFLLASIDQAPQTNEALSSSLASLVESVKYE